MSFASEMAEMANDLLAEFGSPRVMTLIHETATGEEYAPGDPTETEYIVNSVVKLKYYDSTEAGRMIDERRREVIISTKLTSGASLSVAPVSGDKLEFDGHRWMITAVGPVSPGGEVIVYKLEVER